MPGGSDRCGPVSEAEAKHMERKYGQAEEGGLMKRLEMLGEVIDTDVLIIGGGIAGLWCALTARDFVDRVILVDKGFVGKTSHSAFSVGGLMALLPGDTWAWLHRRLQSSWLPFTVLLCLLGFARLVDNNFALLPTVFWDVAWLLPLAIAVLFVSYELFYFVISRSPEHSPGANDNASGAAAVLAWLHGLRGYFPDVVRMMRDEQTGHFEVVEVLKLQSVRNEIRDWTVQL